MSRVPSLINASVIRDRGSSVVITVGGGSKQLYFYVYVDNLGVLGPRVEVVRGSERGLRLIQ